MLSLLGFTILLSSAPAAGSFSNFLFGVCGGLSTLAILGFAPLRKILPKPPPKKPAADAAAPAAPAGAKAVAPDGEHLKDLSRYDAVTWLEWTALTVQLTRACALPACAPFPPLTRAAECCAQSLASASSICDPSGVLSIFDGSDEAKAQDAAENTAEEPEDEREARFHRERCFGL